MFILSYDFFVWITITGPILDGKTVSITYVEADGTEKTVDAEIGKNLLDVAHANHVELEGV
jgi:hypothetical protein